MKTSYLIPTIAAAISITPTGGYSDQISDNQIESYVNSHISSQIQRVPQEKLDLMFTAKDLIGTFIFDSAGEKLGAVVDVQIPDLPSSLKTSNIKNEWNTKKEEVLQVVSKELDSQKPNVKRSDSVNNTKPTTMVYLSVGGVLGISDDIVSVPISSLSYNEQNERYTITAVSKKQLLAISETKPESGVSALKQNFPAEQNQNSNAVVADIQNALDTLENRSEFSNIIVQSNDNKIILTGNVRTEQDRIKAEDIAQMHTTMKIENLIFARENFTKPR